MKKILPLAAAGALFCGCASIDPDARIKDVGNAQTGWHYRVVEKTNLPTFTCSQKISPVWWLKNSDDIEPPDWYKPDDRHREFKFALRNPCHNFFFYVAGVADKRTLRVEKYEGVFRADGGWNAAVTIYRRWRLPFVSFNGKFCRFYFGWRERGNLGCKVNFGKKK